MEEWDKIIQFEENIYKESKIEGMNDTLEVFLEGNNTGFQNGYILGVELGFIKEIVYLILNKNNENDRIKLRCQQILEKIDSIPEENVDQADFVQQLKDIQSLYRSLGSLAIPLWSKPQETVDW